MRFVLRTKVNQCDSRANSPWQTHEIKRKHLLTSHLRKLFSQTTDAKFWPGHLNWKELQDHLQTVVSKRARYDRLMKFHAIMLHAMPFRAARRTIASCVVLVVVGSSAFAQERRAAAPQFDRQRIDEVFFNSLEEALGGPRPTLASLRDAARSNEEIAADAENQSESTSTSKLVSATTLESEFKRIKLRFDGHVASPGAFKGGGFQDARVDLTVLATLMAVISQYDGDVRWKTDAAAARDLLAKTATSARSGTTTAFREAQQRQGDLQSLLSGTGVPKVGEPGENDWSEIADRTLLMSYMEELIERLEGESYDADTIRGNEAGTRRDAEMLGLMGVVISKEGMETADDEDYVTLAKDMKARAMKILRAIEIQDYAAAEAAVSTMRESCDNCHQDYR